MRKVWLLSVIVVFSIISAFTQNAKVTQGSLYAVDKKGAELGQCPLKNTSVKADISGFLARVTVTQEFENNFSNPIEAVYTFPLSQNSAVDAMTMRIGERIIRGRIMKREEAQKEYDKAKSEGKTASLLNQERPNIFTQAVANIMPSEKIIIEISYVETLKYEDGGYEFVFPMTVGPRYIPNYVPDANKITPLTAATRAGYDVSIEVNLNAGVPIEEIRSNSHEIATTNFSSNNAKISLRNEAAIPNKDFILRYDVTGNRIEDALLLHRSEKGGFFTMILSPPDNFTQKDITPKEIVFVLDTSGSMSGFPIEKAKEAMKLSLDGLNPNDTFNLITFAGETAVLFDKPVPATADNLAKAQSFLASKQSSGGTEMMKAIRAALEPTKSQKHLRIVCFMTDGYVGNEAEIIGEIQKHPNARIFSFGIGNSVNRFLLDKMAEEGRGEVEYVSLDDDGSKAARKFFERIRTPLLTDISIDWNGLPVTDVYPQRLNDLFSSKPIVLNGLFTKAASGKITLNGKVAGQKFVREIAVNLPENEPQNEVLATLWARRKVDGLMSAYYGEKDPAKKTVIQEQITSLGIEFRLLTQFTSFVAVEERIVNQNGVPTRVEVPVETPEGMKNENSLNTVYRNWIKKDVGYLITSPGNGGGSTGFSSGTGGLLSSGGGGGGNGNKESNRQENRQGGNDDFDNLRVVTRNNQSSGLRTEQSNPNNELPNIESGGGAVNQIIKRIEEHQRNLKSLRADIKSEKYNAQTNITETGEGAIMYLPQANGLMVRFDWTMPREESISIVRDNYLLYVPKQKTALIGKFDTSKKNALTLILNVSKEKLKENYTIKYLGEEILNSLIPVWHLELTPNSETDYKKVELWVDGNGTVLQVKTVMKNDDTMTVQLTNLQKNVTLNSADFRIELPKDTKIIKESPE